MDDIRPIETIYKSYRFRSRLEARWGVFFDSLGIKYRYEEEGFELPDGTRYLPDFKLIDFDCFVEIKPTQPTKAEMRKAALIPKRVYIFAGDVWPGEYCIHLPIYDPLAKAGYSEMHAPYLGECQYCAAVIFADSSHLADHYQRSECPNYKPYSQVSENEELGLMGCIGPQEDSPRLLAAYTAARQARFEYGERGQ